MLPGVGCRLTEQALSGRTLAWLSRPLQWWMIDVFFMEQQRFSKITQVNTFLLFSGLAVVVAGRGYTGVDRTTVINAARTIKPITQLFHSPGNLPRLSPHSCLLLSLPWPEGLQIHVSKQKQQENLQFKIFLSKIGTPWRNGEVCTVTQLPKTSITLPLRKKPPIIWSATLWPKMDPWNYTVNLLCRSMDGFLIKLYVAIWEHCRCRFGKIIKQYGSTPILHWPWYVFYEQGLCLQSMRGPEAAHCLFGECWYSK